MEGLSMGSFTLSLNLKKTLKTLVEEDTEHLHFLKDLRLGCSSFALSMISGQYTQQSLSHMHISCRPDNTKCRAQAWEDYTTIAATGE